MYWMTVGNLADGMTAGPPWETGIPYRKKLPEWECGGNSPQDGRNGPAFARIEPEMVTRTKIWYRAHPDRDAVRPGRKARHGRNQFVLDFSREEVEYIYQMLRYVLTRRPSPLYQMI